jgi:hypothetical protein
VTVVTIRVPEEEIQRTVSAYLKDWRSEASGGSHARAGSIWTNQSNFILFPPSEAVSHVTDIFGTVVVFECAESAD